MIPYCASMIVPVQITDALLVSCTVPEPAPGETEWNAATAYTVGQEAIRTTTHRKYKRLVAGTTPALPEADIVNWLDIGATLKWAQFDRKIGTQTTGPSPLTTVLRVGSAEGLALLELQGQTARVRQYDRPITDPAKVLVFDRTIDLDGLIVTDVYDWMFGTSEQKLNAVITDLPGQYTSGDIEVTITSSGTVGIGVLAVGRSHSIGATEYGAGAGIINWGKVSNDGFGGREWIEGDWASRVTLPVIAERFDFPRIHRLLANQRSTPCIYIGSELAAMEPLIVYGVYRDAYITVPNYPTISYNLEIEGLSNA